jgi:tryptophanyl-tRNA synthetase (EC 6.1.1.2)
LASGVDYSKDNVFLYRQSQIPAHSELAWILSCFGYYGELQRMIQFKEKAKQQRQNVSVGLFTYPILMAADILLYNADYVPVGEDQKQHLELTRDLAIRFNNKFGDVFVVPKPWSEQLEFTKRTEGVKIYSLTDPTKKMSKSITDPKGTILLTDDPELAAKKILSATTDALGQINWDWDKQPGITNLLQIYSLLKGISKEETIAMWQGQTQYKNFKQEVADLVQTFLMNLQAKFAQISDSEAEAILNQGASKAAIIAKQTLTKVQKVVGLVR